MLSSFAARIGKGLAVTLLLSAVSILQAQNGCPTYSASCNDPLPPLNLSGTWIEKDTSNHVISTWTITATGAVDSVGDLDGTVSVAPIAQGCPNIQYTIDPDNSFITVGTNEDGDPGYTAFEAVAKNPNPAGTCQGTTPVSSRTINGKFSNKNNDNSTGSFSDGEQISPSGPALFVRSSSGIEPTSETISSAGPDPASVTKWRFSQTLTGASGTNIFYGRQVYESTGTPLPNDGCYIAASKAYPYGPFVLTGSAWNVGYTAGAPSGYGIDVIGYPIGAVQYYRQNIPTKLPCTGTLTQNMNILTTSGTNPASPLHYATHTVKATISQFSVTTTKDSIGGTVNK